MRKINNNGFTLLELLISIFILTTVILLGYKIINKSTIETKYQDNINKGQLNMNDMNNYLTKDLEQSSKVTIEVISDIKTRDTNKTEGSNENLDALDIEYNNFINDSSSNKSMEYIYTIKSSNKFGTLSAFDDKNILSKYKIIIEYKDNRYRYSLSRLDYNNTKIDFVNKENLRNFEQAPFMIKGSNPYIINMQYNGKDNKIVKHEFEVASRYRNSTSDGENDGEIPLVPINPIPTPPKPEELPKPPGFDSNYTSIGYWVADESKCVKNNLYTWINYNNQTKDAYGLQGIEKNVFDVNANLSANDELHSGDNSGRIYSNIGYINDWKAEVDLKGTKAKDINKIMIYLKGFTTLNSLSDKRGTITNLQKIGNGSGTIHNSSNGWNLYGGSDKNSGTWYEATLSGGKKENFNIFGKLSIDKSNIPSGYALVVYGESGKDETTPNPQVEGDIVFEFTKNSSNNTSMEIISNVGNNKDKKTGNSQNRDHNISVLIKNDSQEGIHITGMGDLQTNDPEFRKIKAVQIKLQGNLSVKELSIADKSGIMNPNSSSIFNLPEQPGQYGIRCKVVFDDLIEGVPGKFIINLIYK